MEEPFGQFAPLDEAIQIGSPVVVVALWAYWCIVARRERLSANTVVPSVGWAASHLAFALWLGVGYFYEPWNR
jgi:hypothetical protein